MGVVLLLVSFLLLSFLLWIFLLVFYFIVRLGFCPYKVIRIITCVEVSKNFILSLFYIKLLYFPLIMRHSTSADMRIWLADVKYIMQANKHSTSPKLDLASVLFNACYVQISFHLLFSCICMFLFFRLTYKISESHILLPLSCLKIFWSCMCREK